MTNSRDLVNTEIRSTDEHQRDDPLPDGHPNKRQRLEILSDEEIITANHVERSGDSDNEFSLDSSDPDVSWQKKKPRKFTTKGDICESEQLDHGLAVDLTFGKSSGKSPTNNPSYDSIGPSMYPLFMI